jgi:hypothetical protein
MNHIGSFLRLKAGGPSTETLGIALDDSIRVPMSLENPIHRLRDAQSCEMYGNPSATVAFTNL